MEQKFFLTLAAAEVHLKGCSIQCQGIGEEEKV